MRLVEPKYLDEIATASKGRAMYDQLVIEAVQAARDAGFSWQSIGQALCVSRQAARERYGKHMRGADG